MHQLRAFLQVIQYFYTPLIFFIAYFVWQSEGFWVALIALISIFSLKYIVLGVVLFVFFWESDADSVVKLITYHLQNMLFILFFYYYFFGVDLNINKETEFIENTTKTDFFYQVLKVHVDRDLEEVKKQYEGILTEEEIQGIAECSLNSFYEYMESKPEEFGALVPNFNTQEEMNDYSVWMLDEYFDEYYEISEACVREKMNSKEEK
tara:strand:+ start:281 stop:901 length:621 start_codon:yes stop_codon:yes gene_type:complete